MVEEFNVIEFRLDGVKLIFDRILPSHSSSMNIIIFRNLNGKLLLSVDLLRIAELRIVE